MAQEISLDTFDISDIDSQIDALEFNSYASLFIKIDEYSRNLPDEQILNKAVYKLIASACSIRLVPSNNGCAFKPYLIMGENRSAIPDDFTNAEKQFFFDCIGVINNAWVKARFADILWNANRPRDFNNAKIAAENYLKICNRSAPPASLLHKSRFCRTLRRWSRRQNLSANCLLVTPSLNGFSKLHWRPTLSFQGA